MEVWVWLGTIAFAAGGALAGVRRRYDLVGVLLVASITAVGGGAVRDLVVGRLPPATLTNEALLWAVALTGLLVFFTHGLFHRLARLLYLFDTLGLGVFAALGAASGMEAGLGFWGVVFAGTVSGVGGGVLRDLLTQQVPGVFYRAGDWYATAAAGGAAVFYLLGGTPLALAAGALAAVLLRLGSRGLGLKLPTPREGPGQTKKADRDSAY